MSRETVFRVRHQAKQRLLLRALEQMEQSEETPLESAAVEAMVIELERLLGRRQRRRELGLKRLRVPRVSLRAATRGR